MASRVPLVQQVKLSASGAGSVTITLPGGTRGWVGPTTVTVSSNAAEPFAQIYHNGTGQTDKVTGTYQGSNSTDPDRYPMLGGDTITCAWSGGDAGAIATLRVIYMQSEG